MSNPKTKEQYIEVLKSLPEPTTRTRTMGGRFKFNPTPKRLESSITGVIARHVINAARVACMESADQSCDHHEVAAICASYNKDISPKRAYATLLSLTSVNEYHRTASAIFIRVREVEAVKQRSLQTDSPDDLDDTDGDDSDVDDTDEDDLLK